MFSAKFVLSEKRLLTFCIQHLGDVQVLLCHVEGCVQVGHRIVLQKVPETKHHQYVRAYGHMITRL